MRPVDWAVTSDDALAPTLVKPIAASATSPQSPPRRRASTSRSSLPLPHAAIVAAAGGAIDDGASLRPTSHPALPGAVNASCMNTQRDAVGGDTAAPAGAAAPAAAHGESSSSVIGVDHDRRERRPSVTAKSEQLPAVAPRRSSLRSVAAGGDGSSRTPSRRKSFKVVGDGGGGGDKVSRGGVGRARCGCILCNQCLCNGVAERLRAQAVVRA